MYKFQVRTDSFKVGSSQGRNKSEKATLTPCWVSAVSVGLSRLQNHHAVKVAVENIDTAGTDGAEELALGDVTN